jgi:hypothetical protein
MEIDSECAHAILDDPYNLLPLLVTSLHLYQKALFKHSPLQPDMTLKPNIHARLTR